MSAHLRRRALSIRVDSIVSALVKLCFPPIAEVLLQLQLKLIDIHFLFDYRLTVKRDVLKAEYPLKHLLLVLEYNLFDPILGQSMDVFPQVVILVSLQIPEIFHLLLQHFHLLPQSILYLSLPRGVRFRVSLQILLTNHGKSGILECLTEIIDENLDLIKSNIVLLREILHSIQLKQHFLDVSVLLTMLGV